MKQIHELQIMIENHNNNEPLKTYESVEIKYTILNDELIEVLKTLKQYKLTAMSESMIITRIPYK